MPAPISLAEAEAIILSAIESPEAKAVVLNLVKAIAATVESKTSNSFLRQLEDDAFALVEGYLAPAPVTPAPAPGG